MKHLQLFLIGFFSLMGQVIYGQTIKNDTVVFICEHGAGRSAIAAAFFNKMAKEKKLNYHAIFRGIHPDSVVGPAIQKGLIKDSFDIDGWKPILLSKHDIESASQIVTMDCALPEKDSTDKALIQWSGIPMSQGYAEARDQIIKKVDFLIQQLVKAQEGKH